jgi:hypothetical protein
MNYESPTVELIGSASDLIQNLCGPRPDGGPFQFSQGCHSMEE